MASTTFDLNLCEEVQQRKKKLNPPKFFVSTTDLKAVVGTQLTTDDLPERPNFALGGAVSNYHHHRCLSAAGESGGQLYLSQPNFVGNFESEVKTIKQVDPLFGAVQRAVAAVKCFSSSLREATACAKPAELPQVLCLGSPKPLVAVVMDLEGASRFLAEGFPDTTRNGEDNSTVDDSPIAGFKSTFAKEVARKVRDGRASSRSLSMNRRQGDCSPPSPYFRSKMNSQFGNRLSCNVQTFRYPLSSKEDCYSKNNNIDNNGGMLRELNQADSLMTDHSDYSSMARPSKLRTASSNVMNVNKDDSNLWMTHAQFARMLDKQEVAENGSHAAFPIKMTCEKSAKRFSSRVSINRHDAGASSSQFSDNQPNRESGSMQLRPSSYLDNDAKIPFGKLKQTVKDLGLSFSEGEWSQLCKMLFSGTDPSEFSSNFLINNSNPCAASVVRNGDFFAALQILMKNKHHRRQEERHKHSIKSDSGGELESCRSSDSELQEFSVSGLSTSAESDPSSPSNQQPMSSRSHYTSVTGENSYLGEKLAEKETELLKVKLECKRLQEDNLVLNQKITKDFNGGKTHELEKEVKHLRWELNAMNRSRQAYEDATNRLVTFLEQVTSVLQGESPVQRKLLETARAEVSRVARRAKVHGIQGLHADKRFSLGSQPLTSTTKSVKGLDLGMGGSLLSLSTTASDNHGSDMLSTVSSDQVSSSKARHSKHQGSFSSATTIPSKSKFKRMNSPAASSSVQRSHSSRSKDNLFRLEQRSGEEKVKKSAGRSPDDYVNTDIINKFLSSENFNDRDVDGKAKGDGNNESNSKNHVCAIRIGDDTKKSVKRSVRSNESSIKSRLIIEADGEVKSAKGGRQEASQTEDVEAVRKPVESSEKTASQTIKKSNVGKSIIKKPSRHSMHGGTPRSLTSRIVIEDGQAEIEETDAFPIPTDKKSQIQVLVSSNSNNPAVEDKQIQNQPKFKSLGDLHMEEGLPSVPRQLTTFENDGANVDDRSNLATSAQKLLRSMKQLLVREKTLTITPKKLSKQQPSSHVLDAAATSNCVSETSGSHAGVTPIKLQKRDPDLQLLSQTSFPGLPLYPALAASRSSPWNC